MLLIKYFIEGVNTYCTFSFFLFSPKHFFLFLAWILLIGISHVFHTSAVEKKFKNLKLCLLWARIQISENGKQSWNVRGDPKFATITINLWCLELLRCAAPNICCQFRLWRFTWRAYLFVICGLNTFARHWMYQYLNTMPDILCCDDVGHMSIGKLVPNLCLS